MKPAWSLKRLPDWAQRHFYLTLFDVVENAGGELRFVGGCVRDHMLEKDVENKVQCSFIQSKNLFP